jgi:hypothetical protein
MSDDDAETVDQGSQKKGLFAKAATKFQDASASMQTKREAAAQRAETAAQIRGAAAKQRAHRLAQERAQQAAEGRLYEYAIEVVRETLVGDRINTDALKQLLTRYSESGWRLKTCTETSVKGRMGPGGVSGLILIFERKVLESDIFVPEPGVPVVGDDAGGVDLPGAPVE